MEKTIYDLKLHETITVGISYQLEARVTRVEGGWLYQYLQSKTVAIRKDEVEKMFTPVFVPYSTALKK